MPENYEVVYTHPGGATAHFVRQGGELDSLAKGLDTEQFWVFKQVKALLARNEPGDVAEANRMMASIGFQPLVKEITPAAPAPGVAAMRSEAFAGTAGTAGTTTGAEAQPVAAGHGAEAHHGPQPSIWPLYLALSAALTLISLVFVQLIPGGDFPYAVIVTAIGLALVLVSIIGWGTEPFHVEM
jgi:hypothetical protein